VWVVGCKLQKRAEHNATTRAVYPTSPISDQTKCAGFGHDLPNQPPFHTSGQNFTKTASGGAHSASGDRQNSGCSLLLSVFIATGNFALKVEILAIDATVQVLDVVTHRFKVTRGVITATDKQSRLCTLVDWLINI